MADLIPEGRPNGALLPVYVGIDPGQNGGVSILVGRSHGESEVRALKLPEDEYGLWDLIGPLGSDATYVVIEQQVPRPTWVPGQGRSSILKSTCLLYGQYCLLKGMLHGAGLMFREVMPQVWQKGLRLRTRHKGETDSSWKNHLKAQAKRIFPGLKVTLKTADALLIAEYCRRWNEGLL